MTDSLQIKTFHDGRTAPTLGIGTWQVPDDIAPQVVQQALALGYRSIDTAAIYANESGVGKGIRASGIPRDQIFVATKLWHDSHAHGSSRPAFEASLERLGLDYVDLYMIHWPVPHAHLFVQAWESLIQLRDEGLVKSIGVCNFDAPLLQELLDQTGVLPVVNQVELHPRFQQASLRQYHTENDIVTEAWSPLAQATLQQDPVLKGIAERCGRTPAQVILRWHVQVGNMVIPKTTHPERLKQNSEIFDFELSGADMAAITRLDAADGRLGPDPTTYG